MKKTPKIVEKIPIWNLTSLAHQFDYTCDEIEKFNNVKFLAITPLVVNSAFTCELYIKSLLYISKDRSYIHNDKIEDGHDLYKLFKKLDPQIKKEIYRFYKRIWRKDQKNQKLPRKFRKNIDEKVFYKDIKQVKDTFPQWRYSFESNNQLYISLGILSFLRLSLRIVVEKYSD